MSNRPPAMAQDWRTPERGIGKRDQGFLRATQVEWGLMLLHRPLQALDVAVYVGVEKCKKKAKVVRVSFVRCGGHREVGESYRFGESMKKNTSSCRFPRRRAALLHADLHRHHAELITITGKSYRLAAVSLGPIRRQ